MRNKTHAYEKVTLDKNIKIDLHIMMLRKKINYPIILINNIF